MKSRSMTSVSVLDLLELSVPTKGQQEVEGQHAWQLSFSFPSAQRQLDLLQMVQQTNMSMLDIVNTCSEHDNTHPFFSPDFWPYIVSGMNTF